MSPAAVLSTRDSPSRGVPLATLPIVMLMVIASACGDTGHEQASSSSRALETRCELALEPTGVVLRSDPSGNIPDPQRGLTVDSRGRWYTPTADPGVIARWERGGAFEGVTGGHGDGPEELGHVAALHPGPGDTIHVFHEGRWSLIAPDLSVSPVARSPELQRVQIHAGVILEDGRLLAPTRDARTGAWTLIVVDRSGSVVREVGRDR